MISVDGITYNLAVTGLKRTASFLDKTAERTEDGILHRQLIGVYYNYSLEIGYLGDMDVYNAFWDKITEPVEFHTVVVPTGSGDYTFIAHVGAEVSDSLRRQKDNVNYFGGMTVNFIGQAPARTP